MTSESSRTRLLAGVSILVLGLAAGSAEAQTPDRSEDEPIDLGTIYITGEKLRRSLTDTAVSVEVLSGEEIASKTGKSNVADVISGTPNVVYTDTVGAPVIRGQDSQGPNFGASAFMGGTIPRATVNIDGHYQSFYEFAYGSTSIWDLNSIEVFRGPQTSSQGANSIAGAIIVNTNDPSFEPEGAIRLQYGSRNSRRAAVMVSGPIAPDLAARFTFDSSGRDTFLTYTNPAFSGGDQDFSYQSGRLKLLWQPADLPGFEARLSLSHTQSNRPTIEAASAPYDELISRTASMPTWDQTATSGVLDLSYDFGTGVVLSNQLQITQLDVERNITPVTQGSATVDMRTVSNETLVTLGDDQSTVSGVAGLYVSRITSDDWLNNRGISEFHDDRRSLGLFTEANLRFADAWTLTGGLRYQRDKVTRTGTTSFAPVPMNYEREFEAWLPKLALAYEFGPELTVGALYSKGYNPGGINLSFATSSYIPFEKETVNNYEIFLRSSLLDDRLKLNANIFYNDFKNSQRLLTDYLGNLPYGAVVVNADKAEAYGIELDVDYSASDSLNLRAGVGLLHTKIGNFSDALGNSFSGNRFSRSPGSMVSLGADWNVTSDFRISGDVRYTDGYYSADDNNPAYQVGSYTVANLRVTWSPRENMELFAYANNLFDARKPTWRLDDRTAGGIVGAMLLPREVGIGLDMKF